MPLIKRSCIDQIRQQASLVDVASTYVQLRHAGRSMKGLSPFTSEKTPSFFVDPERNVFKCFSTGYAGDIFRFLELKESLTFYEAIEFLAEKFNIPIEYENGENSSSGDFSEKRNLFAVYDAAEEFFRLNFNKNVQFGDRVRNYCLIDRKISAESIEEFRIGFAPIEADILYKHLSKSFSREILVNSGLFYNPKEGRAWSVLVSRFRGRLMFPIKDVQGRTVAFSGRKLPFISIEGDHTSEAKYVNSPETPIFVKGNILFNLWSARKFLDKIPYFFLTEGQLDVIRCCSCGIKTAVAPQGTGITESQLKMLQRYDASVVTFFDGDSAGLKAAVRTIEIGIPLGLDIKCVILEDGDDADSFFLKTPNASNIEVIKGMFVGPVELVTRSYRSAETSLERINRGVIEFFFDVLAKTQSSVVKHEILSQISSSLCIPLKVIKEDFGRRSAILPKDAVVSSKPIRLSDAKNYLEGQLLLIFFHHFDVVQSILGAISIDWVDTETVFGRLLFKIIAEFLENGVEPLVAQERWDLSADEKEVWYQLIAENPEFEDVKLAAELCIKQLYKKFLKKSIYGIDKTISNRSNFTIDELDRLKVRRHKLKMALASVDSIVVDIKNSTQ